MEPGKPINIRLSFESEVRYEAEARARDLPLRTYLRQKLEENNDVAQEISELRLAIENGIFQGQKSNGINGAQDLSLLLEMILLLRQIAQPHKVQLAHAELRRLGFEVWEAKENDESR
jgi:hypothetical protein